MPGSTDTNRDQLESAFTRYSTEFQSGMSNMVGMGALDIATEIPSTGSSNQYNFLANNKKWREWVGDRQFQDVVSRKFTVENKSWEYSIDVLEDDLMDDNLGLYDMEFQTMGAEYNHLRMRELTNMLVDNIATWSGDNLFNATHALNYSTTLNNTSTATLSEAAIEAADSTAGGWAYDNGDPTGTRWDTIMVGPSLEKRAWDIFRNRLVDNDGNGGAVDQYYSAGRQFRIIVNPYLTASAGAASNVDAEHYWYLFQTQAPGINAVVFQNRMAPRLIADNRPEEVQLTGKIKYMGKSRFAYTVSHAHLAYRSTASS